MVGKPIELEENRDNGYCEHGENILEFDGKETFDLGGFKFRAEEITRSRLRKQYGSIEICPK